VCRRCQRFAHYLLFFFRELVDGLELQRQVLSGMLVSAELTSYDADGRVVGKEFKERPSAEISRAPYGSNAQWTFPAWVEAMGLDPGSNQYDDLAVLSESTWISYSGGNNGYDEAGRVKGYTYTGKGYTHTYTYAYAGWDSYREQSVTGSSSNSNYKTTTTTLTYDTAGRQIEMREKTVGATLDDRVRTFALDGNGMIVSRRDGTVTSANVFQQTGSATAVALANHHFVHAGGQQVATLNEWGRLDVRSHLTAFSNSDSGRTQVTVQSGDTLRSLAQRVYGNESLWYVIAAANALDGDSGDGPLVAGSSLTVPEVKTSSNDASTFKPYNPGEISGPSTPSLPYIQPPSDSGCGKLGMVIMVVVAVVVSVVTYGQATPYFSSVFSSTIAAGMATGATVGAAASLASNAVGSAMGVTSFSWANVAAGAATGAITGGLAGRFGSIAEALGSNSYGQATGLALANAGGNYAGQKLMGTDAGFSWRSIAASAVGSLVSAKVTPGLVDKMRIQDKFGYDFASGMTGGMVSAGVRSSFGQTLHQSDYMTVVADAFGNALGNAIVGKIQSSRNDKLEIEREEFAKRAIPGDDNDLDVQQARRSLLLMPRQREAVDAALAKLGKEPGPALTRDQADQKLADNGLKPDGTRFDGQPLLPYQVDIFTQVGHELDARFGALYATGLVGPTYGEGSGPYRDRYFAFDAAVKERLGTHDHNVLSERPYPKPSPTELLLNYFGESIASAPGKVWSGVRGGASLRLIAGSALALAGR
jgi:LysM repeat protein